MQSKPIIRHTLHTLAIGSAFILVALLLVALLTLIQGMQDDKRQVDGLIALCPPADLEPCLNHTFNLYQQGYASQIVILSTSPADVRYFFESQHMPASTLHIDGRRRNHQQTIQHATTLAYQQGIQSALVVDAPEAMLLNLKLTRDMGLDSYGSPIRSTSPSALTIVQATFRYWGYVLFTSGTEDSAAPTAP